MIPSLLDNDLYKFTMQRAVWERYPDARVSYQFISRRKPETFTPDFLEELQRRITALSELALTSSERQWLEQFPFFSKDYLDFLEGYRFNPSEVTSSLTADGVLVLEVGGNWARTILWEVPLLALISETYYELNDPDWPYDAEAYYEKTIEKGGALAEGGCLFADFGTRRRRSYSVQESVVRALVDLPKRLPPERTSTFGGTSNVHLAHRFGVAPVGTMAHEWIMGHAGLFGVRQANRKAMEAWLDVFQGRLGIALTDTYTSALFRHDFTRDLAEAIEGVRQDSGSPERFADDFTSHYRKLGIDPAQKKFVFSDSLTTLRAREIANYVHGRAKPMFGIGTHLTNDFSHQPALDIVIKMTSINEAPVVKISDDPLKATGEKGAIKEAIQVIEEITGQKLPEPD